MRTFRGKQLPDEEIWAITHAEQMSEGQPFTLRYADAWDAANEQFKIDPDTVAFIATLLPALGVPLVELGFPNTPKPVIEWLGTSHGIALRVSRYVQRLSRKTLVALASDERIQWIEIDYDYDEFDMIQMLHLSIGLMFLKEYQALCASSQVG